MAGYDDIVGQMQADQTQAGTGPKNPYDDAVTSLQEDQRAQAAMSVGLQSDVNPDRAAQNRQLAQRYNTTPEVVDKYPDEFRQRALIQDTREHLAKAPALQSAMTADPSIARIAHDDVPTLAAIEQAAKPSLLGDLATGANFTIMKVLGAWDKAAVAMNDELPDGTPGKMSPEDRAMYLARGIDMQRGAQEFSTPKRWTGQVTSGLTYLPFMEAAPFVAGGTEGTSRTQELLDRGVPADVANKAGLGEGTLQAGIQMLPLGKVLFGQGAGTLVKSTLAATAKSGLAGAGQSVASDTIASQLLRNAGYGEQADEYEPSIDKAWNSALFMAALHMGGQGVEHLASRRAPPELAKDAADTVQAEENFQRIQTMAALAADSRLRDRDPESFKQLVKTMTDDSDVSKVYVGAHQFAEVMDKGGVQARELIDTMPDLAAQMREGLQTNGDVQIPMGDYLTHIAGSPVDAALQPHLKIDPDGKTYAEAQEFEKGYVKQMQDLAEKVTAEQSENAAFGQSQKNVFDQVKAQLEATGRFTPDATNAYAALHRDFHSVLADRLGITPEEAYAQHGAKIEGADLGNAGFFQGAARDAYQWQATGQTEKGPIFQGNGFVLDPIGKIPHLADAKNLPDFVPGGMAEHGLTGHAAHVTEGAEVYHFAIAKDGAKVGDMVADVKDGRIVAIHDIATYDRGSGTGTNVVAHLAANSPDGVRVIDALDQAKGFWDARGNQFYDVNGNGHLDWQGVKQYLDRRSQGAAPARGDASVEPAGSGAHGIEARELSPEEVKALEAQGFKFKQGERGSFVPESRTIHLAKDADLSTFLHESGHFFLDTYARIADAADAPAGIKADMAELLKWFGVKDLDAWHSMSMDEQRPFHEKFAESFEEYLREGKAPNLELQGIFAKFRSWLVNIYKSMAPQLTPEVRGVMDRMMATEDSIKQAEAIRGYTPLFTTRPEGMTDKAWSDYQALGQQGTDEAIAQMQAKSLRDMRWLSNAKAKEVKAINAQARDVRREVRIQARREILSQPVFRAQQFLTRKLEESDRLPGPPKGSGKEVDPTKDSLFTAIAKLGGLKRAEVESQWGWDPKEATPQPAFGKPLLRREGGMAMDEMAEHLAELGYLSVDEYGRGDVRELEDKFDAELHGDTQHSYSKDYGDHNYKSGQGEQLDNPMEQNRGLMAGRIDRADLQHSFVPDDLKAKLEEMRMTAKVGLHPDVVAEMFGYESAESLARDLANAGPAREAIEGLTDQKMLEQHGELTDPRSIERAAEAAIHNEARARFMATGLKVLTKSPIPARQLVKGAREAAEASIARKTVADVNPRQYELAEAKANKEALAKVGKDPAAAVQAQRAALLNNQLVKAATAAQEDVVKGLAYVKKFAKDGVRAKIDVDIRDQIDDLLSRFDFRLNPNKEATRAQRNLQQWHDAQVQAGYTPSIMASLFEPSFKKAYKDMTVEEFRGLMDSIRAMEQVGRERNRILVEGEKVELTDYVNAHLVPKLKDMGERFTPEQLYSKPEDRGLSDFKAGLDHFASWWRSVGAILKPQEYKRNMLDRHEILGPFGQAVFERIFSANYRKVDMLKAMSDSFRAKADELGRDWQDSLREMVPNSELMDKIVSEQSGRPVPMKLSRGRMLMMALHSGNESNFDKLVKGYGWDPAAVMRFLGANMTAKDIEAVNHIWSLNEVHWPETVEMLRRLGQTAPPKIEARPFELPAGKLTGGYAHIDYDPLRSRFGEKAGASAAKEIADKGTSVGDYFKRMGTTNGAMNARIEGYTDAINLDFHTIERAMQATIHDLAYREALVDVNKILEHPDFKREFLKAYGRENLDAMHTWLGRIANSNNADRDVEALSKVLQYTRTGMVMNAIALRASTVAKHGGSAGIKTMGYFAGGGEKFLGSRMAAMTHDYKGQIAGAIEKFPEIRARLLQQDRDFRQTASSLVEAEGLRSKAERFGHAAVAWADMVTAVPTAWAAYDRAVTVGIPERQGGTGKPMTEAQAVTYASKVVREAHGTNIESARSNVMTAPNEAVKMFTTLYGFMNNTYGQMTDAVDKLRTANIGKPEVLARSFAALIVPALWAGYLRGTPNDKNKEGWGAWVAKSIGEEAAATVPFVRDAWAMAEGMRDSGQVAVESWMGQMVKAGRDVYKAASGEKAGKLIEEVANALGMGLHIPGLGQAGKTAQYIHDVHTGKEQPKSTTEAIRKATVGGK